MVIYLPALQSQHEIDAENRFKSRNAEQPAASAENCKITVFYPHYLPLSRTDTCCRNSFAVASFAVNTSIAAIPRNDHAAC